MVKLSTELFEKTNLLIMAVEERSKDKKYVNELINSINAQFLEDIRCHQINRVMDARNIADTINNLTILAQREIK